MANQQPIYKGLPKKFWVVTKCFNCDSILKDICFLSDILGMIMQYLKGLRREDVAGIPAVKSVEKFRQKAFLNSLKSNHT